MKESRVSKLLSMIEMEKLVDRLEYQQQEILRLREEGDKAKFRANTLLRSNVQLREKFSILAEYVVEGNLGYAADYLDELGWRPEQ